MTGGFTRFPLGDGVNLYVLATPKFKTVSCFVYLHTPLRAETVTPNALLPMVLVRGTARHPSTPELVRHLDDLYGATVGFDVSRRGETQSLMFRLDMPSEVYLAGADGLLERGLDTLADIILHPALQGDGLGPDFTAQEKANLEEIIKGLINNKLRYSLNRCREVMCEGEPFSLHQQGRVADLPDITPQSLLARWQQVLETAVVDILMVGDVDPAGAVQMVKERFDFPPGFARRLPETLVRREAGPMKRVDEPQPVSQGVMAVGFRTGTVARDPDYFAMVVANGILGGYAHSKLFVNVREKHSLAYQAYSVIEAVKGVGFMYAGVEFANFQQALDISMAQLQALQQGQVTPQEMSATVKALVNDTLAAQDNPGRLVDEFVGGVLAGRPMTTEQRIAGYRSVTPEQAAAAAARFQPETIFALTRAGGAGL